MAQSCTSVSSSVAATVLPHRHAPAPTTTQQLVRVQSASSVDSSPMIEVAWGQDIDDDSCDACELANGQRRPYVFDEGDEDEEGVERLHVLSPPHSPFDHHGHLHPTWSKHDGARGSHNNSHSVRSASPSVSSNRSWMSGNNDHTSGSIPPFTWDPELGPTMGRRPPSASGAAVMSAASSTNSGLDDSFELEMTEPVSLVVMDEHHHQQQQHTMPAAAVLSRTSHGGYVSPE